MNKHELIIQLQDLLDRLEHTRRCETGPLYEGKRCICGVQDLRDDFSKYMESLWQENRPF